MSQAKHTKLALDESRMLMLGAQILLGFQLQAPFQEAFQELTRAQKTVESIVLGLLVVAIGLIIAPSARHRIVENGEATPQINRFITRMLMFVLVPFAAALALDVFVAVSRVANAVIAGLVAGCGLLIAAGTWYGPALAPRIVGENEMTEQPKPTSTSQKIEYVLTEARVVLPGVQAVLGFQLAIVLTSAFTRLPFHAQILHEIALGINTFAMILLMAPAIYHRIVFNGADALEFHRIASRLLLAASVFLALGLSADVYVVVLKVFENNTLSLVCAVATACVLIFFWYVWPMWRRRHG